MIYAFFFLRFKTPLRSHRGYEASHEKVSGGQRDTVILKSSNVKKFQMVLKRRTTSQETIRLVNVSSSD